MKRDSVNRGAWNASRGMRRLGIVVAGAVFAHRASAQNRGVYPLGMSALSAGALADAGLTYANQLLAYTRDRAKDNEGNTEAVQGAHSVVMDMNTLTWASRRLFSGVQYAASATLPFARNSLTSDVNGQINKGSGFADSYYLPLIVGRNGDRVDIRGQYGFLAPTGKFASGASDNVGSGYWTHTLSSGQTVHLGTPRRLALSAFEMYEFHGRQRGADIRPGATVDLDGSLMANVASDGTPQLQIGAVGYAQRQCTARSGSDVSPESSSTRYAVNSLGAAAAVLFPKQRASVAFKYFEEFSNRSTFEGHSFQLGGAIKF